MPGNDVTCSLHSLCLGWRLVSRDALHERTVHEARGHKSCLRAHVPVSELSKEEVMSDASASTSGASTTVTSAISPPVAKDCTSCVGTMQDSGILQVAASMTLHGFTGAGLTQYLGGIVWKLVGCCGDVTRCSVHGALTLGSKICVFLVWLSLAEREPTNVATPSTKRAQCTTLLVCVLMTLSRLRRYASKLLLEVSVVVTCQNILAWPFVRAQMSSSFQRRLCNLFR